MESSGPASRSFRQSPASSPVPVSGAFSQDFEATGPSCNHVAQVTAVCEDMRAPNTDISALVEVTAVLGASDDDGVWLECSLLESAEGMTFSEDVAGEHSVARLTQFLEQSAGELRLSRQASGLDWDTVQNDRWKTERVRDLLESLTEPLKFILTPFGDRVARQMKRLDRVAQLIESHAFDSGVFSDGAQGSVCRQQLDMFLGSLSGLFQRLGGFVTTSYAPVAAAHLTCLLPSGMRVLSEYRSVVNQLEALNAGEDASAQPAVNDRTASSEDAGQNSDGADAEGGFWNGRKCLRARPGLLQQYKGDLARIMMGINELKALVRDDKH